MQQLEGSRRVGAVATGSYSALSHAELVEAATRHESAMECLVEESRRAQAQMRAQETQMAASIAEAVARAAVEKERAAWHAGRLDEEQAKVARLQSQVKDLELQLQLCRQQQAEGAMARAGKAQLELDSEPEPEPEPEPAMVDAVPSWRTYASNLADTIDIARALPNKQMKQGNQAGSGDGEQRQPRPTSKETLIAYASCQFGSDKKLFADLKQNDRGRFIKLAVAADGKRQHVFLPLDAWSHLTQMIQAHN